MALPRACPIDRNNDELATVVATAVGLAVARRV